MAMKATGVYWQPQPIYHVLKGHYTLLVVNAAYMHAVPGRKTDVRDAEWIAGLLQHGLLRASFVPSREQRALRDLTRTSLTDERSATVNRIQQVLEDANIKLASVATAHYLLVHETTYQEQELVYLDERRRART